MRRISPFLLLAPFLLLTAACDSGGSDDPPAEEPFPEVDVDDGSVELAAVYIADVSGTEASFFRINVDGPCEVASLRLDFNIEAPDETSTLRLTCTTVNDQGQQVTRNPSGPFRYDLNEQEIFVRSNFGYTLTGTAPSSGDFIDATIERARTGQTIDVQLLAVRD